MSVNGSRGPYAKSAEVRRRILEACLEVFAERGFHSTTVKEVAARAGISQRGLVHHFASKEDLLSGVLQAQESARESLLMDSTLTNAEGVFEVVAENARHPEVVELHTVLSAEATSPDHPAHDYYLDRYAAFRHYLAESFTAATADRGAHGGLDADDLAAMFIAMMDGLQLQWLYNRNTVDIERLLRGFLAMMNDSDPAVA